MKFDIMSLAITNLDVMEMEDHNCCDVTVDVESCPITCHETPKCECSICSDVTRCAPGTNCGPVTERQMNQQSEASLQELELQELKELIDG